MSQFDLAIENGRLTRRETGGPVKQSPTIGVRQPCPCRKSNAGVLVVQVAENGSCLNAAFALDGASDRCVFAQG